MQTALAIIGQYLGATLTALTINGLIFYNKAQINDKLTNIRKQIADHALEAQSAQSAIKEELIEKVSRSKDTFEQTMKEFINILSEIKQADKDNTIQFITLIDTVKDELKNDYTSRYNDLLVLINTKANISDFNRLEQKFDKVTETITELKTIVELQLNKKEKN